MMKLKKLPYLNYTLVTAVLLICIVNIVLQYSANDQSLKKLFNDICYIFLGFMVMLCTAFVDKHNIRRAVVWLYLISIILLIIVATFGSHAKGATRWINYGGIHLQPSEIAKLSTPFLLVHIIASDIKNLSRCVLSTVALILPAALIAKQPDLGTAVLILINGICVFFLYGVRWKYCILLIIVIVGLSPVLWNHLHEYQQHRILSLINPTDDERGKSYQVLQSIIAIGDGGVNGSGYLQGNQVHLNFIPEKHTDFIATVLAEEFGYIGICTLMTLYLIVIFCILKIMHRATEEYNSLLLGSFAMSFTCYIIINMGMVSGILPVVGVPLPLISYGGTALIISMLGFGIVLSIDRQQSYQ